MSIVTNLFFSWCIYSSIVPPLDSMQERWEAVQSKTPQRLWLVIDMKKRKAADSYFQATRNKNVMMLHSNRRFPPSSIDDSVPTGSKKAFLDEKCWEAQNKQGLPVLPEGRSCACDGGWERTGERHIAGVV
jgi:hypothetical protein